MEQLADVVIISIFGRGNWLASELAIRGWKVTLVDVSDKMGEWEPEDCEGPFGLLDSSDLIPTQKTRLTEEGEAHLVPQGMTFWLPEGPLECKSELTSFHLSKRGVPKEVEAYLRRQGLPNRESERERKTLNSKPYEDVWFAHLAHQMASTAVIENDRALKHGWSLPVFAPFWIRRPTRTGWQKGLKACQAAGVKLRPNANIKDIRLEERVVDAVEVQDDRAGVEKGRAFVWMLSGQESERFGESVRKTLYPNGVIEPEWFWTRFRIEMKGRVFEEQIPQWALTVEDVFLPWTHTNMMVLRRCSSSKELDAWVRLPIWARAETTYLESVGKEMERVLTARLPQAEPHVAAMPPERRLPIEKLGPPRFPVFAEETVGTHQPLKSKNLFFDGPEHWETLDWLGQFRHQNKILAGLEKLKAVWDAEARRAAQRLERDKPRSPSP